MCICPAYDERTYTYACNVLNAHSFLFSVFSYFFLFGVGCDNTISKFIFLFTVRKKMTIVIEWNWWREISCLAHFYTINLLCIGLCFGTVLITVATVTAVTFNWDAAQVCADFFFFCVCMKYFVRMNWALPELIKNTEKCLRSKCV